MRIAIDAMGGDYAPKEIVLGTVSAAKELPNTTFLLYGDQNQINPFFEEDRDFNNIEVIHTEEKIEMDEDPVRAVRRKKDASMVMAAYDVKEGKADGLFSAGNTGALLAAGLLVIGRIPGIDRPALMINMPVISPESSKDSFIMLDVGANAETKAINLEQYATFGSFYASHVKGIDNPTVALLSNGTEANKGNELIKEAHKTIREDETVNFIGNVESRDLLEGIADVVISDGFTGNAVLKSIEGTAMSLVNLLKDTVQEAGVSGKIGAGLLKTGLSDMRSQLDYSKHGGGILIGVKAPVLKTHGTADAEAVFNTLLQLNSILESGMTADLNEKFSLDKA